MSNASASSSLTDLGSEDNILLPTPSSPSPPPTSKSAATKTARARKRKTKATATPVNSATAITESVSADATAETTVESKPKRKRRKKETSSTMPLAPRVSSLIKIGAHVSAAKGVQNAVTNSVHIGGNAFGVFLKNQRRWDSAPLKHQEITQFREFCERDKYNPATDVLPHGSYLVNLANPDDEKRSKAYECFVDELKRCELLGIQKHNFHPGSAADRAKGIKLIAECINRAHSETKTVQVVLENSAGTTNSIGSSFEDLKEIIDQVEDQSRVGVCIDTCHAFAAGYDLRTKDAYEKTWAQFDKIVGFKYLAGLHLNDSRSTLGSKRDLHANLGRGFLSLEPFRLIVNDKRMKSMPMILETPAPEQEIWAEEIKLLYSMVGKETGDPEILEKEKELQELGKEDRQKQLDAQKRKAEKSNKAGRRRKKKAESESGETSSGGESDKESEESDGEDHMH